jgi:hypothetical protein
LIRVAVARGRGLLGCARRLGEQVVDLIETDEFTGLPVTVTSKESGQRHVA